MTVSISSMTVLLPTKTFPTKSYHFDIDSAAEAALKRDESAHYINPSVALYAPPLSSDKRPFSHPRPISPVHRSQQLVIGSVLVGSILDLVASYSGLRRLRLGGVVSLLRPLFHLSFVWWEGVEFIRNLDDTACPALFLSSLRSPSQRSKLLIKPKNHPEVVTSACHDVKPDGGKCHLSYPLGSPESISSSGVNLLIRFSL